ncbi:DNA-binding protein [Bradyrhizobium sp. SZCCHNPS2010]|uniref:helix-turn-helix transcriptional regulator n=1 Tax=Bradyrhizobium sp. SZCCHNPS2010 TaxID=3057333 RepID=UPI0029161953|nr:DNA-binding protein [Bradyrhizobium sp. SZCCHNPS2010]
MSKHLLTANAVCAEFGNVTTMTLWRWLRDQELAFPKPVVIRRRRYWNADDIHAFKQRMAATALRNRAA